LNDIYVLCFDIADGKLQWSSYVASGPNVNAAMMDGMPGSETGLPQLSWNAGRVVILTNVGAIAALDGASGVPAWLPSPETRATAPTQFRMDVTENDKEYQVLAELPGVKKEEISITISGNEVAVSAEVKHEKDIANGETVLRAERYYGKIERAFSLGQEVDEATAQAKYNNGVLELTLPKKTVAAARKLAVH
jgi:HSP20 family protein